MAHVLLIEDNPANLALLRYLLEHGGHRVSCAADGREGLAAALAEPPDLVLCDLQMPALDGYEVLAALRASPSTARLPVVAVTAFSMSDDRRRVESAGFDGYLTKPIEPEQFVAQVEAVLRRRDSPG